MVRDHRIEIRSFASGGLVGAAYEKYNAMQLNGILLGVRNYDNNYTATGSLILSTSGTGEIIWKLTSGTATGNVAQSGLYYPVAYPVNQANNSLSGTSPTTVEIPLFGDYKLEGAGLGVNKSGLGFDLIYKMG
jgi:hypothetical protein